MPTTGAHRCDDGVTMRATADGTEVPVVSGTDWARVDATANEDIARAVTVEPDAAPLLTGERLAVGRIVWPADVAATRRRSASARSNPLHGSGSRPAPCATGSRAAA